MASAFSKLCNELAARATPALLAAGFSTESPPFNRQEIRYDFKRRTKRGQHVISILFNKYRRPQFSVQICIEPASGLERLGADGGTLVIGSLTPKRRPWPFPFVPFNAERPLWQRMLGRKDSLEAEAVAAFLNLLPEIEGWWANEQSSRHILTSRLAYPGRRGAPPGAPGGGPRPAGSARR